MIKDDTTFSSFYLYNEHKELNCSGALKVFLQYKKFRLNLITGEKSQIHVSDFIAELDQYKVSTYFSRPIVIHFFYEFGYYCNGLDNLIEEKKPLALYIEYENSQTKEIYQYQGPDIFSFDGVTIPSFEEYHRKFEKVYSHLVNGDCYQVNLTIPIILRMEEHIEPKQILQHVWKDSLKVGAYAHGTYCHALDKFFLSNSPECLFQVKQENKQYKIVSLPIKGTMPVDKEQDRQVAWQSLINSKKDQAELYMITDLMRNDLTKINFSPAKVTAKKAPLNVPGLIHQFSVVEAQLSEKNSLKDIMLSIFPGGSITGAPKKRVMEIIKQVEQYDRRFYCGSTLLLYGDKKTASINIRSAEINYSENEVVYGSGGGVTLLSQAREEYDEILAKLKSFMLVWGKH